MNTIDGELGIRSQDLDRLSELKRADFFLESAAIADERILEHPLYREHLATFGAGREGIAQEALLSHQFGPVADKPTEFNSLLRLMHEKQRIWRQLVLDFLGSGSELGFDPLERSIVEYGLQIASVVDEIYLAWRVALVDSPLGHQLQEMGADEAARWLEERQCTNPYTIVLFNSSGELTQVAYSQAFPEAYQHLDRLLGDMLERIRPLATEASEGPALVNYFQAYRQALIEKDLDSLEHAWAAVDDSWMDIRGPFQPVHAMESYMEPARLRVDPEFRIVIADGHGKAINARALMSQERIIRHMARRFGDYQSFQASKRPLEQSLVHAGTTIVMSGCNMNFRLAGQNVPNRVEIKKQRGTKILLDVKSMEIRSHEMRGLMKRVFGEAFTANEYLDEGHLVSAGVLVGGHEVCHNLFMTETTEEKLGKALRSLVEETKADFGGTLTLLTQVESGELEYRELQEALTCLLAAELRDLKSREEESHRPYYIKCIAYLNMMFNSGLIKRSGEFWQADYSNPTVVAFFGELQRSFEKIANAYDRYDTEAVRQWSDEYFVESPEIVELLKRVA